MGTVFKIKQGDTDPAMVVTLLESDGVTPFDTTDSSSVQLRVRAIDKRAHIVASMDFLMPRIDGKVRYIWVAGDTELVGEHEAVVVVTDANGKPRSFPTDGFFTVLVEDNIEADVIPTSETEMPPSSLTIFGTGYWSWTPTVVDEGVAVVGVSVSVINDLAVTLGPATTDVNGQCLGSDGLGAFRLDPGLYTVVFTKTGVTYTQRLTIDIDGNGDVW